MKRSAYDNKLHQKFKCKSEPLNLLQEFDECLRADLLMHCLLELLVVDDGPDLALAVGGPERGGHLNSRLARVDPER